MNRPTVMEAEGGCGGEEICQILVNLILETNYENWTIWPFLTNLACLSKFDFEITFYIELTLGIELAYILRRLMTFLKIWVNFKQLRPSTLDQAVPIYPAKETPHFCMNHQFPRKHLSNYRQDVHSNFWHSFELLQLSYKQKWNKCNCRQEIN